MTYFPYASIKSNLQSSISHLCVCITAQQTSHFV